MTCSKNSYNYKWAMVGNILLKSVTLSSVWRTQTSSIPHTSHALWSHCMFGGYYDLTRLRKKSKRIQLPSFRYRTPSNLCP